MVSNSLYCYNCKLSTKTIEPINLKRFDTYKIRITGCCEFCLIGKTRHFAFYLNPETTPIDIESIPMHQLFKNNIYYDNGTSRNILNLLDNFINSL